MSGLELLAVVGCVAAVVSAYRDGSVLVQELRDKRRRKKALKNAPSQQDLSSQDLSTQGLEQSLTRGRMVVQDRYNHEFQSLGPQEGQMFASGDRECMDALKNIIIHLQSQVILNLRLAWQEDTFVDFSALQVSSRITNAHIAPWLIPFLRTSQIPVKNMLFWPCYNSIRGFCSPHPSLNYTPLLHLTVFCRQLRLIPALLHCPGGRRRKMSRSDALQGR